MRKTLTLVMSCALLPAAVHAAQPDVAAAYPARPIRIVVPQSPGASTDLTARLIGLKLSEAFGQSVIVDNRPGAGSINGTEVVARATPDGHTLLVVASSFTINPGLQKNLPYDTVRDFAPITQVSRFPNLLAAHPAVPVTTLQDVIALAKSKPGQLNYASAGLGTGTHMSAELLKMMTGIDFVHVPFKGGGPAVIAIIGGQTQFIFGTTVGLLPHVRSGKLKAIAVTTAKRSAAAPEIPSFAESGLPGYDHGPWNGFFAPGKTPQAIVDKLNAATVRALRSAEVTRIFTNEGADPIGNKPAEFAVIVKEETAKWAKVIKAAGIKPE